MTHFDEDELNEEDEAAGKGKYSWHEQKDRESGLRMYVCNIEDTELRIYRTVGGQGSPEYHFEHHGPIDFSIIWDLENKKNGHLQKSELEALLKHRGALTGTVNAIPQGIRIAVRDKFKAILGKRYQLPGENKGCLFFKGHKSKKEYVPDDDL